MAESDILTSSGALDFLSALIDSRIEFLVVGASAAVLQGVPLVTQDIDLWFKILPDPKLKTVLAKVGGIYVPSFGHNPPMIAGESVKFFDIVLTCQGLSSFESEYSAALAILVGKVTVPTLPLERVIHSKKAANRLKDIAALPALEAAQKTILSRRSPTLWSEFILRNKSE